MTFRVGGGMEILLNLRQLSPIENSISLDCVELYSIEKNKVKKKKLLQKQEKRQKVISPYP